MKIQERSLRDDDLSGVENSEDEIRSLLRKFALLNAISHAGKPDKRAVVGRIMAERADLRSQPKKISLLADEILDKIVLITPDQQQEVFEKEFPDALGKEIDRKWEISKRDSAKAEKLPPLPNAVQGAVVTRFPPEPNGFMHIGHAKAAILGSRYARKYDGRFIIRFDDTNPAAEKLEYYTAFLEALSWLDIKPDLVKNASDDMEKFYAIAERMIRESTAFVCTCPQETMREMRSKGEQCTHRFHTIETNFELWSKMQNGEIGKNEATLRFVGNMKSLNTTMRDPVLFRIVKEAHPIQGSKYRVWPTYDFDGAVEDSLDGVTHAMRSKEYELRDELYHAVLRSLKMPEPEIVEFSRLSLQNTTVSKRSLKKLILEGKVDGWDDPRLPTIAGLRRRGFVPDAIKKFILSMGVSKVESEPTWDLLESYNRKMLDPMARRYFFVPDPLEMVVQGAPKLELRLKYHPEEQFGERVVRTDGNFLVPESDMKVLPIGSIIRLIEAYNVKILEKHDEVILARYLGNEKFESDKKVQWVSQNENTPLQVKVPGPLLIGQEFNPESLKIVSGFAELASKEIHIGSIVQFVRFGFCRMDDEHIAIFTHR